MFTKACRVSFLPLWVCTINECTTRRSANPPQHFVSFLCFLLLPRTLSQKKKNNKKPELQKFGFVHVFLFPSPLAISSRVRTADSHFVKGIISRLYTHAEESRRCPKTLFHLSGRAPSKRQPNISACSFGRSENRAKKPPAAAPMRSKPKKPKRCTQRFFVRVSGGNATSYATLLFFCVYFHTRVKRPKQTRSEENRRETQGGGGGGSQRVITHPWLASSHPKLHYSYHYLLKL